MYSPAQPRLAQLLSDREGALTVMIFLVGLESSLECLRFDSLSVAVVDGAIVVVVADELSVAGCDVCSEMGVCTACVGVEGVCGRARKEVRV